MSVSSRTFSTATIPEKAGKALQCPITKRLNIMSIHTLLRSKLKWRNSSFIVLLEAEGHLSCWHQVQITEAEPKRINSLNSSTNFQLYVRYPQGIKGMLLRK